MYTYKSSWREKSQEENTYDFSMLCDVNLKIEFQKSIKYISAENLF